MFNPVAFRFPVFATDNGPRPFKWQDSAILLYHVYLKIYCICFYSESNHPLARWDAVFKIQVNININVKYKCLQYKYQRSVIRRLNGNMTGIRSFKVGKKEQCEKELLYFDKFSKYGLQTIKSHLHYLQN